MRKPAWSSMVLAVVVASCATNPATGKRQIALVSEAQETQMGRQADREIAETLGVYPDARLAAYVSGIGARLAASSERRELPWTFRVIDDPAVNAFALPGGFIYVTRGMLAHLMSEAELAGVLGHVAARHSVSQISKAQLAGLGFGIGMILRPELRGTLGDVAQMGLNLLFLKYGRDDEREADDLSLRYMSRAGYDRRVLREVFARLRRVGEAEGGGRVPGWLSTHPSPDDRIERIATRISEQAGRPGGRVNREGYLRQIDGIAFGPNPREGFFQDGVFYHPELRFRFDFPRGWRTVNRKEAVGALSPDQDAALVISLARHGSPEAAAREFFNQRGVAAGPSLRGDIGRLPAVANAFVATTSQEELRGIAAFIAHQGRVFQVLGYAVSERWGRYQETVSTAVSSFDELRDRRLLQARPERVQVVTLPSSMTLRQAAERFASSEPLRVLSLINRADEDEQLPAGTEYKRIVGGGSPPEAAAAGVNKMKGTRLLGRSS